MRRYILDTTNYEKFPPSLRRRFPFKDGEHYADLDLIECEVPKDVYQEIYNHISQKPGFEHTNPNLPIGIRYPLPIGVSLTCVGEYLP